VAKLLVDLIGRRSGRKAARSLTAATGSVLVLLLAAAPSAHAAPGDLDPTFSDDGKVLSDIAGGDDGASAIAVQPDGKIVAAGFSSQPAGGRTFAVVRYDSAGLPDPSFGENGIVTTGFGDGDAAARAVAVEADGGIVVAGTSSQPETGWDFALVRYEPDGGLDPSFGDNGRVTTDFDDVANAVNALVLQPDGKLLVAGESRGDFALARYDADGSLDTSFSGDGVVTTDFAGKADTAYAVALQGDGRIVAAGSAFEKQDFYDAPQFFALARYQADGTPDSTFSGDGILITAISDHFGDARAHAVAVQQDGKIVLGGALGGGQFSDLGLFSQLVLARYNPSGSQDSSFDAEGQIDSSGARALAIQANGGVLAAGWTWFESEDFLVARWHSNGALDSEFGGPRDRESPPYPPGAVADFGHFNVDRARALAIQPDGKIVAAGRSAPGYDEPGDFALARFRMDSLDPADADADGVANNLDSCDHVPGAEPDGCPHYARTVTIRYSNRDAAFRGRVSSDQRDCKWYARTRVAIFRHRPGDDVQVGRPSSASVYWVRFPRRPGWYYAKLKRSLESDFGVCEGARSPMLRVTK
jgi:uncharacterized delta-60 repeat protein